jgi:formylglycine-generating enzyme required for sulfatase activity
LKIFLSYASEDRAVAEQLALALGAAGHDVFFDREDLPPGDEFHSRIRRAIERSDQFVFLVSPYALDAGSYTLTELEIARKTWPNPARRVLPVLVRPTELAGIPGYLKSVTLLAPEGNVVASVVDAGHRIARARRQALLTRCALAGAGLAVLVAAFGVYWLRHSDADEITGKDGAPALRVPRGVFTMGDDENAPRREIYTDGFYIDKFEVTAGRYAGFMKATGPIRPPEGWDEIDLARGAQLPVTGVDWHDAQAYCRWAGKRLPTEAEWEKAARGDDGRLYPWGDETPSPERANFANSSPKAYDGGLTPAGAHPAGRSPFGVHDMAGNAAEWVADWYAEGMARADTRNPQGPQTGKARVVRGGGRFDPGERMAATRRYYASPHQRSEDIGFRCAQ